MLNDFLYFWMSWFLWIVVTFFVKGQKYRTAFIYWILLTMIGSQIFIVVDEQYVVSLAFISLMIGAIILYQLQRNLFFQTIIIFSITCCLTSLKIFLNIAPIWLILSESLMIVIIGTLLTLFLTKNFDHRLIIFISSLCFSDLLFNLLLLHYFDMINIGDMDFLYEITLGSMIILIIHYVQHIRRKWMSKLQRIKDQRSFHIQ